MSDSFYVRDGDRFLPTERARGPWSADAQHAGPPAALIVRALERPAPDGGMRVARFTMEILRSVPMRPLTVETREVRPGRRVRYVEAVLRDGDEEIARASAWMLRQSPGAAKAVGEDPLPHPQPEALSALDIPSFWGGESYLTSMEVRLASGGFFDPGPAAAWMRMRVPLVDGEEPSPIQRVLVVADSGNGVSMEMDPREHLFVNTELSVHLLRPPEDEWVCLDARTRIDAAGIGLAESLLWDRRGRIGRGDQTLFVETRS